MRKKKRRKKKEKRGSRYGKSIRADVNRVGRGGEKKKAGAMLRSYVLAVGPRGGKKSKHAWAKGKKGDLLDILAEVGERKTGGESGGKKDVCKRGGAPFIGEFCQGGKGGAVFCIAIGWVRRGKVASPSKEFYPKKKKEKKKGERPCVREFNWEGRAELQRTSNLSMERKKKNVWSDKLKGFLPEKREKKKKRAKGIPKKVAA